MGKNKAFKAGIGYTIGNYLIKGLSFLTLPLFARIMSVTEYGNYSTYVSYESVLFVIVGLGISYSIKSARHKWEDKVDEYISSSLLLILINSLVILFVANVTYPLYDEFFSYPLWIVNILICHSLGSAFLTIYNSYVALEFRYRDYLILAILNAIFSVAISVCLILVMPVGMKHFGRILGAALPVIVIAIYVAIYFSRKSKMRYSKENWKYALDYGLPMIPHGLSIVILSQFDRIMIKSMVGSEATGMYSFAYNIYMIISITATSLSNVWGPWFFKKKKAQKNIEINKNATRLAVGMMLFTVLVMLVSPELILVLGGVAYREAVYCVLPIIAGGYFAFLYTIPVQVEYYKEKTKWVAVASSGAAILNVILNYLVIPYFGYVGAAYTTLVTYVLYFVFHLVLAFKFLQKDEKSIFSIRNLFFASGCVILCSLLTLTIINSWYIRYSLVIGIVSVVLIKVDIKKRLKEYLKKQ